MANEVAPAEAPGPPGDALRHRSQDELAAAFRALPRATADQGRLALIVSRRANGVRDTPAQVRLTAEDGVPGDRWQRRLPKNLEAQITVMRRDVAELIANGQPLSLFGDNLFVDLDLAAANLPPGTELRVGTAILAVTPKPHNGCAKFLGRFGEGALAFVSAPTTRDQNLRGIYWRVVEPGEVRVGDRIEVIRRGDGGKG